MKTPFEADSAEDHMENNLAETNYQPDEVNPDPAHLYFIAAVKIVYTRNGANKERTVNVLLDLLVPYITQQTLHDLNKAAAGRVMEEGNIKAEDILGAVVMNISPLGEMTPTQFRNPTQNNIAVDKAE